MTLPVNPPLKPMLAKSVEKIPEGDFIYEPKWDGFRCLVFRDGDEITLGSRNDRPLTRYFPELLDPLRAMLPDRCVVDGELVVTTSHGTDFDQLGQRIHPAESRVQKLSVETPASFVAFDLIALDDLDLRPLPFRQRHETLFSVLGSAEAPIFLTPSTEDPATAADWFERFEGAGFDGVIAKPAGEPYVSDKRTQFKIKHRRTADVVVGGYRVHKNGGVGSLLVGVFGDEGNLHHIGVATGFDTAKRAALLEELAPYEVDAFVGHPWAQWADAAAHVQGDQRLPGAPSRWSSTKTLDWTPMRCELVAEIAYQGLQNGARLRHPGTFLRWRPDKDPSQCRYDQMDQVAPAELAELFGIPRT